MGHDIPKASLESINEVAAGYNKTVEPGEKIDDEDVSEARDITKDTALRQKKFFAEIGVLEKDGRDYNLTEKGDKVGKLIRLNHEDEAYEVYAELLEDWEPTAELVAHAGEDGLSDDELMDKVSLATATELNHRRKKVGANALIDLFTEAGFLEEEGDEYYAADRSGTDAEDDAEGQASEPTPDPDPVQSEPSAGGATTPSVQPAAPPTQARGIDISLDISGDDDPENVRQLLLAIRNGSEADLEEYDAGDEA